MVVGEELGQSGRKMIFQVEKEVKKYLEESLMVANNLTLYLIYQYMSGDAGKDRDVMLRRFPDTNRSWYICERDWYCLLSVFPQIKASLDTDQLKEIAADDKAHLNWECCLLRAWIKIFGNERTKRDADDHKFGGEHNESGSFWEDSSLFSSLLSCMKDGELLHTAIEVGSLVGVRATAWPAIMKWTNGEGKTALEVAEQQWGADNEITAFLRGETM